MGSFLTTLAAYPQHPLAAPHIAGLPLSFANVKAHNMLAIKTPATLGNLNWYLFGTLGDSDHVKRLAMAVNQCTALR